MRLYTIQTGQSAFCVRIKRAGALLALARRRGRKSVRAGPTPHDENPSPAPVACTRQIPADEQTAPPADVRAWAVSIRSEERRVGKGGSIWIASSSRNTK